MKNITAYVIIIICTFACKENPPKPILFADLFEIGQIDSIRVYNNRGEHLLAELQFKEFITELENMSVALNMTSKTGAKGFTIYALNREIQFSGRTLGDYFETNSSSIMKNKNWINSDRVFFKTNNMNLDNY